MPDDVVTFPPMVVQSTTILKSKHFHSLDKINPQAAFEVRQAANNSPPMRNGTRSFTPQAIHLVQEAYNHIAFRLDLRPYPLNEARVISPKHPNTMEPYYGPDTEKAIKKLQEHLELQYRDGAAGSETLKAMDDLLVSWGM